ncbi:effector-associated constant component EACC1 [Planosporangium sp. 12N6]|uniref:effector-associated constant component EACC1 n=1 Tax=Planosporangium spinosum TaxID=3402278 RepID=UPI003CFBABB1
MATQDGERDRSIVVETPEALVDVTVEVEGDRPADELRSLQSWLLAEHALRGRVRFAEPPPAPGTLGGVVEALTVVLGPGGVATAMVTALISWIRRRPGTVSVKVTRTDGASFELSAPLTGAMSPAEVRALTADLTRALDGPGEVRGDAG